MVWWNGVLVDAGYCAHLCAPLQRQSAEVRRCLSNAQVARVRRFAACKMRPGSLVSYTPLAPCGQSSELYLCTREIAGRPEPSSHRCDPYLLHRWSSVGTVAAICVRIAALTHHCSVQLLRRTSVELHRQATQSRPTLHACRRAERIGCRTGPRCQPQYSSSPCKPQPCSRHCRRAG